MASAWQRLYSFSAAVGTASSTTGTDEVSLYRYSGGGTWVTNFFSNNTLISGTWAGTTASAPLNLGTNTWTLVTQVLRGGGNPGQVVFEQYLNGSQVTSQTGTLSEYAYMNLLGPNYVRTFNWLGDDSSQASLSGGIKFFAVYRYALTPSELGNLHAGMLARYGFTAAPALPPAPPPTPPAPPPFPPPAALPLTSTAYIYMDADFSLAGFTEQQPITSWYGRGGRWLGRGDGLSHSQCAGFLLKFLLEAQNGEGSPMMVWLAWGVMVWLAWGMIKAGEWQPWQKPAPFFFHSTSLRYYMASQQMFAINKSHFEM